MVSFNFVLDHDADTNPYTVSSIAWLENDVFFIVYTPNALEDDMGQNPASSYYILTRRKQAPFLIQKLPEICPTLGATMKRTPAFQFIARLRDYKPHLKDVLMVASTASTDVGLVTRSDKSLGSDDAAQTLTGQFTTTEVSDDTRRAALTLSEAGDETSVIGMGTDLTSTENVVAPIPGADITESSTPLPALVLLNNEGVLSAWWFVYSDSVRQKVPYSGLAAAGQAPQALSQPQPQPPAQQQPAFGQSGFGNAPSFGTSAFGKPSGGPAFGTPSPMGASPFGKPSAPAFGSPSALGGSAPAFGKPSTPTSGFGVPSQLGSGFGSPSRLGQPQFGQSGFGTGGSQPGETTSPAKSILGSGSGSGGGIGSFSAAASGLSSFGSLKPGESPFAKAAGGASPFANPPGQSSFGTPSQPATAFPPKSDEVKNPFGQGTGTSGFVLGSSFKGDGTAANDGPKPDKPSSGAFSFGGGFDEMVSSPSKPSPPGESMDDMTDAAAPVPPAKSEPTSIFGAPSKLAPEPQPLFGKQTAEPAQPPAPAEPSKPAFSWSNTPITQPSTQNQTTSPLSAPSDKTATPNREQPAAAPPTFPTLEAPLPPDSTTRASYAPGDTSASSNVSKSSVEDAPLPPDFTAPKKPSTKVDDAPLPPDFITTKKPAPEADDAPLPPDFLSKPKKAETPPPLPEEAPLPPDPTMKPPKTEPAGESVPIPDGSDADSEHEDETGFSDSGEEITHEESKIPSPKPSAESSFTGLSEKSSFGGPFSTTPKNEPKKEKPLTLFGEIPKQPLLPPPGPPSQTGREPIRSPSPTRVGSKKGLLPGSRKEPPPEPGSTLTSRKVSLTQIAQRDGTLRKPSDASSEEKAHEEAAAQDEEEDLYLSNDDEDERLRADLARPVEPVDTLDPFLPHQNYMEEPAKPGMAGMTERMYRDINSMIDTLGINARSMESYLLHQQSPQSADVDKLVEILKSEQPTDVLDEKLHLTDIGNLEKLVTAIGQSLDEQRVQVAEEKMEGCRELLTKDLVALRSQCASIRKTLDAHTDTGAILANPLSAEQAALQHDLRTAVAATQAKMTDLEQSVSLLRAAIADGRTDGADMAQLSRRPTAESVSQTVATMMNMVKEKSSDIDLLESKLGKLGLDMPTTAPSSREGTPLTTPRKNTGRVPRTPGSRGSVNGSAYHTPESASRGVNFRASNNGSARGSRLRMAETTISGPVSEESVPEELALEEGAQWKANTTRRKNLVGNLKKAFDKKQPRVRSMDEL